MVPIMMVRRRLFYSMLLILLVLQALLNLIHLPSLRQENGKQNENEEHSSTTMALNQTMLPSAVSALSKGMPVVLAADTLAQEKARDNSEVEMLQMMVKRLKEELAVRQDAKIAMAYYNSTFNHMARDMRDPHRIPYARVRRELRLNEPIAVSGGVGPAAGCNPFCGASGKASFCPPKCIFMQKIRNPGRWIDACIFNGHTNSETPLEVRQQGCIPVAEGMESDVNYPSLQKLRNDPETWMRSYRLTDEVPANYYNFFVSSS